MTRIIRSALLALSLAATSLLALAQGSYPNKPIKWIVPNPAGGGTDAVMRVIAEAMAPRLGQPLVIENRPGAATMVGAQAFLQSAPDGYTLLTGDTATFATNQYLYKKVPYNAERDFASVSLLVRFPLLLVVKNTLPFKSVEELLAYAKARPGKLTYASPGTGLPHHLAMELFMERTGTQMVHVPYRGSPPALQDMVGDRVDLMFVDLASGQEFIKDGRVRALAAATDKRLKPFPGVPTLSEAGIKDFEVYAWQGVVVPAKTPAPIIARLTREFAAVLGNPSVQQRLWNIGVEPITGGPSEFSAYMHSESQRWGDLIKAKGISIE